MNYDDWKTTPPDYEEPREDEPEEEEADPDDRLDLWDMEDNFPDDYEQEPIYQEDTGSYQNGYRIYRDGTMREDFGSDR